ncbi:hypothetical protein [Antrihabitans spumae]|uniref:DUF4333 domain-containing protein n=1 Tax=Antrihabitans spumae TaxID=3373370 RepID=A0ABW7KME5_9NOCA
MDRPLIDTARVRFSGLSAEDFEIPDIGEQVTYTIKATCTTHTEQDMANEGTRRTCTMKIDRVVEGISKAVNDAANGQLALVPDDESGDEQPGDDSGLGAFKDGPSFSAGE